LLLLWIVVCTPSVVVVVDCSLLTKHSAFSWNIELLLLSVQQISTKASPLSSKQLYSIVWTLWKGQAWRLSLPLAALFSRFVCCVCLSLDCTEPIIWL
jgi:hypothetical protein